MTLDLGREIFFTLCARTSLGRCVCLYTDQANPVSNKVYERLGYEPVRDEGELVLAEREG